MKRLNLSYINVICVFVLSFAVMEYVNLLIGRVGGFPVLAGVLVSYSVMRYGSFARKNMACYMGIYILEYYGAAEPPVRCGESHLSGLTEPPHFVY